MVFPGASRIESAIPMTPSGEVTIVEIWCMMAKMDSVLSSCLTQLCQFSVDNGEIAVDSKVFFGPG